MQCGSAGPLLQATVKALVRVEVPSDAHLGKDLLLNLCCCWRDSAPRWLQPRLPLVLGHVALASLAEA